MTQQSASQGATSTLPPQVTGQSGRSRHTGWSAYR
jgi:hypothetical protein